ncbi:GspD family T2SS secretin variant LspD [Legionella shakespearei]|uniref:Type II protein secretion LspD n=1 Tax=Legionella shakespearei DSM 23087 TaxID=1122169 RepID=A0A0W0YRF7_9GAMM|nr:GspD family T2SS secretin variant LspD [Legionella shakespearei]KTD59230.1 type II protein secretion LspD [Legionella shakespearei DSM 23087]
MRSIVFLLLALIWSSLIHANDVNISTVTKNGTTVFYLQAGAFNLEKDAQSRQKELSALVEQTVEIKNLADKHLYLVQIGPINDYQTARALKDKLSQNTDKKTFKQSSTSQSSLSISQPPTNADQTLAPSSKLWNLRNADIRAVIAEVSRVTGKNFVIDPRVQGKISIISSTPLSNRELYQVFLSVLQVSGYAAIPNGEIIKIIPNIDAKTQSPDLLSGMRNQPKGDDMMVAVIPVHYVPAEQLVPVLRPLMPQWSSVSAYAPSNMLIMSGRANNIKSLADIIKQVDSSNANGIDIVPLHHALAMDVANTLKDLVKTQPSIGSRTQITIAADDRSNSLLVSGNKTDRIRLRMLILKLDKESSAGLNSNTQVVYLNYLRAEDLVPILAGIAQANFSGNVGTTIGTITRPALDSTNPASSLATGSSSDTQGSSPLMSSPAVNSSAATANTTSASTQNEGSTKPTVQIIGEPNTNSIIINAPASIIRILKTVIAQLDIKPAQLLIEALVAEVDQNDVNSLGIEWGTDQQRGNPRDFRPGFAIINSKTKIDDFQAQIYALARQQKANILSTPSVVVLDNRQAKILVGKQVSVASTSYPNNAGGTTTASPYTTFNRVNVALHLYVRPQITRGQGIQMQIDQGNDTLDPASTVDSVNNPTFKISSIVTSVHVESGDIVVLGGLTQDSIGNDNNRLPILGDIPGVGRLFQHNIRSRDKRVLMVFIKPIILHNERDNLQVTGQKYNDIRQYQLDWLRSQEEFEQSNSETALPPLTQGSLPIPFSGPPQQQKLPMTK